MSGRIMPMTVGCLLTLLVSAVAPGLNAAPAPEGQAGGGTGVSLALTDKGVEIHAGTAGRFLLKAPVFKGVKGGTPVEAHAADDGRSLSLTYGTGATAELTLEDDHTVRIAFDNLSGDADKFRMETMVPIGFSSGGAYMIDGGPPQPFPVDKPESPFLYQGNADRFALRHASGGGFALTTPRFSYQQLQDNREWGWAIFAWYFETPMPEGNPSPSFTMTIDSLANAPEAPIVLIDRFGQHVDVAFEGKVETVDDLRADVQRDKAYYASLNPPATDGFGGLPGSGSKYGLEATGYFRLDRVNGHDVFVTPLGNIFFQLGMCVVTPIDDYTTVRGRESIYQWLPGPDDPTFESAYRKNDPGVFSFYLANLIRKFGEPYKPEPYARRWIERLRKWGFNSGGAWAFYGVDDVVQNERFPHVRFLPLSKVGKDLPIKKVWDPFTEGIEEKMDAQFARVLGPAADDPLVIGWFIANEPLIEDVPRVVPTLKGSESAAKRKLVEMLEGRYGDIAAFNEAWDADAPSFEALNDRSLVVSTRAAGEDMQAYFELFLERRFSLIDKYFRKYAPNHLLIGGRWMAGTANSETLARVAGKYLDVISINYYSYGIDHAFLDRIHAWSGGRPILLSEFHFCSRGQGLTGGVRQVDSQTQRGIAYRNYVEQAVSTGYVVGIQWFIALDQATTGRFFQGFNGEAANTGLVNVADRPYKDFLAQVMKTNYGIYDVILGRRDPFRADNPRFTMQGGADRVVQAARMVETVSLDGSHGEWPALPATRIGGDRLVIGSSAEHFDATYRLAWDDDNLYLFARVSDPTPAENDKADGTVWAGDCIELFTGHADLDEGGSLRFSDRQVLLRASVEEASADRSAAVFVNAPLGHGARVAVVRRVDGRGYTMEAAIPFEALGFVPEAGQEVLFDLAIDEGGNGRRQLVWNGTARNSKDRGGWGRAEFTN